MESTDGHNSTIITLIFINVKLAQKDRMSANQQQVNWSAGEWFWGQILEELQC